MINPDQKPSPARGSPSFALDSKLLKWRFLLARMNRRAPRASAKDPSSDRS